MIGIFKVFYEVWLLELIFTSHETKLSKEYTSMTLKFVKNPPITFAKISTHFPVVVVVDKKCPYGRIKIRCKQIDKIYIQYRERTCKRYFC